MIEIDENNFELNTKEGLVLLDFFTNWCGPCRMLAPVLAKIENIKVFKVDASKNPNLSAKYNISAVPTLIYMRDGVVLDKTMGFMTQEQIQKKVDGYNAAI